MANKGGRPLKEINQKQFEHLCSIQCTKEEICGHFECDEVTLNRWCKRTYNKSFSLIFKEKRQGGKASLRRKQWLLADKSAAMAIFLGKQYLEQIDEKNMNVAIEVENLQSLADMINADDDTNE